MQKKVSARSTKFRIQGKRTTIGKKERRRLLQLALCLGLFLVVFFGKGSLPEGMLRYIQVNTDFKEAFSTLGRAISGGESVSDAFGALLTDVFGAEQEPERSQDAVRINSFAVQAAAREMGRIPDRDVILSRLGITVEQEDGGAEPEVDVPQPEPSPESQPQIAEYTGPALPANATMEYCELGLSDVVTPVSGEITSAYGYRDHPVNGEYSFHSGVDLAAETGTPVAAFASGTVDFIGESEVYGLYIQLDHGNGVTTFYCHCSELYARKGESVSAGQTIAAVGETGNATGAHLHLEIKKDGIFLNPVYYLNPEG